MTWLSWAWQALSSSQEVLENLQRKFWFGRLSPGTACCPFSTAFSSAVRSFCFRCHLECGQFWPGLVQGTFRHLPGVPAISHIPWLPCWGNL